jgi:hypothetical protein
MANFILDALVTARRSRDAVRQIRQLPVGDRDRKQILASWFQEHTGATRSRPEREQYYNQLLGRERNARIRG